MFNLASLIIGFVALVLAVIAFIPLLGWANWFIIPLAMIGAVVGLISRGTDRFVAQHYRHQYDPDIGEDRADDQRRGQPDQRRPL